MAPSLTCESTYYLYHSFAHRSDFSAVKYNLHQKLLLHHAQAITLKNSVHIRGQDLHLTLLILLWLSWLLLPLM